MAPKKRQREATTTADSCVTTPADKVNAAPPLRASPATKVEAILLHRLEAPIMSRQSVTFHTTAPYAARGVLLLRLHTLHIFRSNAITAQGLKSVAVVAPLQSLLLSSVKMTDAGLVFLATLKQLTTLELSDCEQMTDAGLSVHR